MMEQNALYNVMKVRWRMQHMECVRSYAGAQYEFGYMHGWIAAMSWADLIEASVAGELRTELDEAYARALRRVDASLVLVSGKF